jgi:hypothetical protein
VAVFVPDPTPDFGTDPRPFVAMMLAGFVIGVAGHVVRSRALVIVGIGLIFLATFLLPLAVYVGKSSGSIRTPTARGASRPPVPPPAR